MHVSHLAVSPPRSYDELDTARLGETLASAEASGLAASLPNAARLRALLRMTEEEVLLIALDRARSHFGGGGGGVGAAAVPAEGRLAQASQDLAAIRFAAAAPARAGLRTFAGLSAVARTALEQALGPLEQARGAGGALRGVSPAWLAYTAAGTLPFPLTEALAQHPTLAGRVFEKVWAFVSNAPGHLLAAVELMQLLQQEHAEGKLAALQRAGAAGGAVDPGVPLVDELLCQLCMQLNGNPDAESMNRCWQLISLCLGSGAVPSGTLVPALDAFFREQGEDRCLFLLHKT